jgi:ribosomal protein L7/L12
MRIRIWNAFASNNSGSYVIVGSFPSEARAAGVAAELLEVARAHSAWLASYDPPPSPPSPLARYAARYGIMYDDASLGEDWPQSSSRVHPDVWAIGHQVFVYSDYTITMPRLIGHVMYKRGGRVDTELNHTHHPLVAMFEVHFPWRDRSEIDVPARVQDLVDALCADDGALTMLRAAGHAPAWRGAVAEGRAGLGSGDLVIGAVFDDLCAGFTAVAAAVHAVGATLRVRVSESLGEADPLAVLRPCMPPTRHALVDVVLEDLGLAPTSVTKVVARTRGIGYTQAHALVQRTPAVIVERVSLTRAQELAAALRAGNAVVSLRGAAK